MPTAPTASPHARQDRETVARFAARLESVGQRLRDDAAEALEKDAAHARFEHAAGRETPASNGSTFERSDVLKRKDEEEARYDPAMAAPSGTDARAAAMPRAEKLTFSSPDTRVLDQMAARIAECCAATRDPHFSVQFADGAVADSALLSRMANGAIAIQIVGLDPRFNQAQAERLRSALSESLARRRLRIDGVVFARAGLNA